MSSNMGHHKEEVHGCPDLIAPRWDVEFHAQIDAFNVVMGVMLANPIKICDHPIAYALHFLNNAKKNFTTIEREALVVVYVLHNLKHYLLGNKFVFYVDHMVLLYQIKKPQIFKRITKWLSIFLKYNF